jgi:RHH-type rel operon transcriptional repressor/antitoxin RelB
MFVRQKGVAMHAVKLPENAENRLESMAKRTGKSKSSIVREAVLGYLDDIEDYYIAAKRAKSGAPSYPIAEIMKEFGFEEEN